MVKRILVLVIASVLFTVTFGLFKTSRLLDDIDWDDINLT